MPIPATISPALDVHTQPTFESLQHFFEKNAQRHPEKTALIFMETSVSYYELNNKANQLAHYLIGLELKKESIIAVFLKRGISTIIAMLAILKAGYAFLMIDEQYPLKRVQFILQDSQAAFLLLDRETLTKFGSHQQIPSAFCLIEPLVSSHHVALNPNLSVDPRQLAYVIYTSGSTGHPKGVLIEHRGMMNTLLNSIAIFGLTRADRILCVLSLSFDGSIWEVGSALICGGTLCLTHEEQRASLRKLSQFMLETGVTAAMFTPSLLRLLPKEAFSKLKVLISAGEPCTPDLIEKSAEHCRFFNAYGPTEASIFTTLYRCKKNESSVSIGLPFQNVKTLVLNDDSLPTSPGEIGTLYIGGVGLARSYLNRPELTQRKFINLKKGDVFSRWYNSGDRVLLNEAGEIEYVGRIDEELKINGNRINLNEIRVALLKNPNIRNCLVTQSRHGRKKKIIVHVETDNTSLTLKDVRDHLSHFLPKYMLPHQLVKLEKLHLSMSGKVHQ